ncbi:S8 family peptidase [Nocardioides dongkuii]|uniref:S8 family peptidase n=1 Tax=Nocardioides dongkuii TaxID=2760089 RepID=UPI00187855B5|nr:S8 family peptidase [Nocardioides dongkuii]
MLNHRLGSGRQKRLVGLASAGAVVAALLASVPAATAAGSVSADENIALPAGAKPTRFTDGRYVVVLQEPAVAARAAARAPGAVFRADTGDSRAYAERLRTSHARIADEVGAEVDRSYTVATNGFAAQLTAEQAMDLATDRRVLAIEKDVARELDTWRSPDFLGMTGKNGAWTKFGGQKRAGAGVVIADLDTGIWPESKSFAGNRLTRKAKTKWDISMKGTATRMEKADGGVFRGECEPGEAWTASLCTTKIVGARYYPETFLAATDPANISPDEFISTRDGDGHGTHTAGTAAGNAKVNARVEGRRFKALSGMAPAAKLAIYKVCWQDTDPDTGGCYNSAILAAVDDAVSDGADVLNFSISGATDTVVDVVELAFEGAAEAGVFVSASAGNSGPGASTVAHNSPWLTTVAASTHALFENTLVLGNGRKILGASIAAEKVPNKPLVTAEASVVAGGDAADAALCGPDTLDPAKVTGKMVVCIRGGYDRVAKSAEVKRAGGVAMLLANATEGSLDADFHTVPTVHIPHTETPQVMSYIASAGAGATARFELGNLTKKKTPLPQVGGFSSRGPALANDADLLKPDIAAPGVSVLAAVAPPSNSGRKYDLYSGTSMAAPHISGLAAFILGNRPRWEPMDVKSAMMTTAKSVRNADGRRSKDWFGQGAGQVQPRKFLKPGLFVTSDAQDWRGFLTGLGVANTGVRAIEAKDLNVPSLAQSGVTGQTSFTRSFRSSMKGRWKIKVNVPGFTVKTRPGITATRAGDVNDVTFRFTRTTAPLNQWAKGSVTLTGPTKVRMPIVLQPVAVDAPDLVEGEGTSGEVRVPITAGYTGTLQVDPVGLTPAESFPGGVPEGDYAIECVQVTEGTDLSRFELDATDNSADLDMYVYSATSCSPATVTGLVGEAATGSADELFMAEELAAGTYLVQVDGFAAGSAGSPIDYELRYFGVGGVPDQGNLTVDPNPVPVQANQQTAFDLSWSGLTADTRYFGMLNYAGSDDPTYVSVVTGTD